MAFNGFSYHHEHDVTRFNTSPYHREGLPTDLLGKSVKYWKIAEMCTILEHYGKRTPFPGNRKLEHVRDLAALIQERGLTEEDRLKIFRAQQAGEPLPPRKPRVEQPQRISGTNDNAATAAHLSQRFGQQIHYFASPVNKAARSTKVLASQGSVTPALRERKAVEKVGREAKQARHATKTQARVHRVAKAEPKAAAKNSANDAAPLADSEEQTCVVCFENLGPENTPHRSPTQSCRHEPNVCLLCLLTSIGTQLNSKVWEQIDCPSCEERMHHQDVKEFGNPVIFER